MDDLISVVIPVYNGAATIQRAVESALQQKTNVEILIIDDASEDGTEEIIRKLQKDTRIRYLRNQRNLGVSASRNKGVSYAKGNYVAFLDADDYWMPQKLVRQMELMKKKQCVLTYTGRRLILEDGTVTGKVMMAPESVSYTQLLRGNVINCSSVLAKKEVLQEFPMEHDECHEDYLMWLRILKKYGKAWGIKEPYLYYQVSRKGKSGNKFHSARMTYHVYREIGLSRAYSAVCFLCYALNGVKKYYFSF